MKKLIVILLSMVLLIVSVTGCNHKGVVAMEGVKNNEVIKQNNEFAFKLFKQLNEEDKGSNIFISPLSVSTALTMTLNGADHQTKEDIMATLSYDMDLDTINEGYLYMLLRLNQTDKSVTVQMANSIWINDREKVNEGFIEKNEGYFDAKVTALDFSQSSSAKKINDWISKSTNKKIPKMIDRINPDTLMFLVNAIYFKGAWKDEFDSQLTYEKVFKGVDGEVLVDMMHNKWNYDYFTNKNYSAVRLPYGEGNVSMYCVLPKVDKDINDVINSFDIKNWEEIKSNIYEEEDITVEIPKFKMEYGIKELKETLSDLGMAEAFTEKADFLLIAEAVYIDSVIHKAVIEVNEKGSEAAAATVVEMTKCAMPLEKVKPKEFIADRPFIFIIADDEDGSILFMGKKVK